MNQLSFGMSAGLVQSNLDETKFLESGDFDPIVDGTITQKSSYFNVDFGASYNYLDFYAHFTLKMRYLARENYILVLKQIT